MAGAVKVFTFFPNFDCNGAFLELINFLDGCEQREGLCKNLVRYSKVSITKRHDLQTSESDDVMSDDNNAARVLGWRP